HGDQPPVAVSGGNFNSEDRGGLPIGLSRCAGHVGEHAGERYNCNQHENDPSHTLPPSNMRHEPVRNHGSAFATDVITSLTTIQSGTRETMSDHESDAPASPEGTHRGRGFPWLGPEIGRLRYRRR